MRNVLRVFLSFATVICSCALANLCQAAILQGLDVVSAAESTVVTFQLDDKVHYQHNILPGSSSLPPRCYIDMFGTNRNQSVPLWLLVDDQHISKVRTGADPGRLRVVLDLRKDSVCSVSSTLAAPFQIQIAVTDVALLKSKQEAFHMAELAASAPLHEVLINADTVPPISALSTSVATAKAGGFSTEVNAQLSPFTPSDSIGISAWGWAQLLATHDNSKDHAEDHNLYRLKGRVGADWNNETGVDTRLKLHAAIDLDRFFYDSELADEETDIKLHETYLQYIRSDWDISFGKQRVRWGKSDQLSPVDSINTQDFRQFITVDLEERALPSWLIQNRWYGDSTGLDIIFQPWFQKSEIEYFDSDWALYRNLRQSIIDNKLAPTALKDIVRQIRVEENKPDNTLKNISAAARFNWNTEQADFAMSYHYSWESLPTITSFPIKNIIYSGDPNTDPAEFLTSAIFTNERVQSEYKRQQTIGFEWETVLDPVGFRGEIAHIDKVAFLGMDLTSERKPVTHLVSGIDYTSATEWYFNMQGSWYHIHDYATKILYFEEDTLSVLGVISKPIWQGKLEFAVKYNYTITDQSSYLQPSVTLKYFQNFKCEIGTNIFSGDSKTLLGSYDRADQLYIQAKYSF